MELVRESGSRLRSIGRNWEDMILPSREDQRNCMDPQNLGQSEWDQKLGNMECVFSLYDKMRWKWDAVYLPQSLPNIYSASLIPPPVPLYLHTPTIAHSTSVTPVSPFTHRRSLTIYWEAVIELVVEMHLEAKIEWSERCAWRPWSIEFGHALAGWDGVNSEMHLEAVIDRVWRCTGRPCLSEFGDALGGRDRASLDLHLEAVIEWVSTCTWRPRSSELRDALPGCDQASLEMHLQAMIKRDWRSTWRRSIWREARQQLSLYSLVNLCLWECRELSTTSAERWDTGWERETVNRGMMLYLVYAVLGVN